MYAMPTTPKLIAETLHRSLAPYTDGEDINLQFARFSSGMTKHGQMLRVPFQEWAAHRAQCATMPWPQENVKKALPSEVGAILVSENGDVVRRRDQDVAAFTWIYLDSDSGVSGAVLRQRLTDMEMCFLMTESATSRLNGGGVRWHLFLPLAQPFPLASRNLPGVDAQATLRASRDWWKAIRRHVANSLLVLGEIKSGSDEEAATTDATTQQPEPQEQPEVVSDDETADSLSRMAYIPHVPSDGKPRYIYWQAGGCIDLADFLRLSGKATLVDPPCIRVEAAKTTPKPRKAEDAASSADAEPVEPEELTHPADGPTPGETTGTLLLRVFRFFNRLGDRIDAQLGKYEVQCPWSDFHSTTADHDPSRPDNSVVIFMRGEGSVDGGFKCYHNGHNVPNQCERATAADVLRWARKCGMPLPDKASHGGGVCDPAQALAQTSTQEALAALERRDAPAPPATPLSAPDQAAKPRPPRFPLPPAFPSAPRASVRPEKPTPSLAWATPEQSKVEIKIDPERLLEMRAEAIEAVARHDSIFQINGRLFDRVLADEEVDKYGQLKKAWLRKTIAAHLIPEITATSSWYVEELTKRGPVTSPRRPDAATISAILAAGRYPNVRELRGVVSTPVFKPGGGLVQKPGYDPDIKVIYEPTIRPKPISPDPGVDELRAAKAKLYEVVADFPIANGEEMLAFGVWLSMIFTKLCRFVYDGSIPLFGVSASTRSSGKGKWIDAAAIIAEGHEAEKCNYSGDDAEDERVIGAAVADEAPIIVLDNIKRGVPLASTAWEMYLTTKKFATRKIGTSDRIKVEKGSFGNLLVGVTGNDLMTSGDMARRILRVDIADRSGHPEDRPVRHKNLEGYCRANRKELLEAALTLLSGYFAAKHKRGWSVPDLAAFASFEEWSSVVREAVVWCGLPDPYLARGKAEDDASRRNLATTLRHLHAVTKLPPPKDKKCWHVGSICELLRLDRGMSPRKWKSAYDFFIDVGVKLDAKDESAAYSSMGKFLKQFNQDALAAEGGKPGLQLVIGRDDDGSSIVVEEVH